MLFDAFDIQIAVITRGSLNSKYTPSMHLAVKFFRAKCLFYTFATQNLAGGLPSSSLVWVYLTYFYL